MAVHHPGLQQELGDLTYMVRQLVAQTMQNAAFGRAGLRVYDGGWIRIEGGGLSVTGSGVVSGTLSVSGRLDGSGTLDWAGPWNMRGAGTISGNCTISGTLGVTGPVTFGNTLRADGAATFGNSIDVLNRLTLGPSGYIEAGTVRIDRAGSYGGRVASTGAVLALSAGGSVIIDTDYLIAKHGSFTGNLNVLQTLEATTKNFKIEHPTKSDHFLRHGCTESPVSGVEYWGEGTLPESGELDVMLPDYFEALTKPEGRAVLITARGFVADWGDISNGTFTVTGTPGGRFSWLVKAERRGADFLLEEPVNGPHREQT